jgi:hypothetical protein
VIASRARLMLLGVLAVFIVGAVASSSASALPTEGPFWHVGGAKLPAGTKKAIAGKLIGDTPFLYGKLSNKWIRITCSTLNPTGSIFNGTIHGESEETVEFTGCNTSNIFEATAKTGPYKEIAECKVSATIKTEPVTNTLWYHTTNVGKTRTATEQVLFTPKTGTVFAKITITGNGCGFLEGTFKMEGNVAAEPAPQNTEVTVGTLTFPTEQQKHVWQPKGSPEETQVELKFLGTEADFVAEAEIKLVNAEKFGIFE